MRLAIEALDARIAQLAKVLGVSLQDDTDVARVLSRRWISIPVPSERRIDPDTLMASQWEELRGMLELHYDLEALNIDQAGVNITSQILAEVEERMVDKGFKFGDDGSVST
jgi:hypothetical protein